MPRPDDVYSQRIVDLLKIRAHPIPVRRTKSGQNKGVPAALDWSAATDHPSKPGVYAFWWKEGLNDLWNQIENFTVAFHGPGGATAKDILLKLERSDFTECEGMVPLYIGKTYQPISNRVGQHLLLGTARSIPLKKGDKKCKRQTTSCQIRDRLDRLFHEMPDTRELTVKNLALSWVEMDCWKLRFFFEDYAVGYYRPLFNLDCER